MNPPAWVNPEGGRGSDPPPGKSQVAIGFQTPIDKGGSLGSFMQTKYLCVLIHIGIKGEVGAVKPV